MKVNPLLIIAVIFAASFAGRAIGLANAALNRPDSEKTSEEPKADIAPPTQLLAKNADENGADANGKDKPRDEAGKDEFDLSDAVSASHKATQQADLLAAIRNRAASLDAKEERIENRMRVLEILEARIEEKLTTLQSSHAELSELVKVANDASEEDITLLAKMYEQMKPARAGEIFDKMNPTFAAGFLTEMNSENAALILTNMSTEQAYEASMIIASRNAAVHQ